MVMQTQQVVTEAQGRFARQLGETFNRLPPKSSLAEQVPGVRRDGRALRAD